MEYLPHKGFIHLYNIYKDVGFDATLTLGGDFANMKVITLRGNIRVSIDAANRISVECPLEHFPSLVRNLYSSIIIKEE